MYCKSIYYEMKIFFTTKSTHHPINKKPYEYLANYRLWKNYNYCTYCY